MSIKRTLTVVLICLAVFGCKKKVTPLADRVLAQLDNGWTHFEASRYTSAIVDFNDALNLDDSTIEANLGIGWSLLLLDDDDRDSPTLYLDSTLTSNNIWRQDAWAGLAAFALTNREFSTADSIAGLVLAIDSSYVFSHRESIDWQDMQLIQGQARFSQGLFDSSWVAIEPLLSNSPYSNLMISDSATWINGSTVYSYFSEILAIVISYLSEIFRES